MSPFSFWIAHSEWWSLVFFCIFFFLSVLNCSLLSFDCHVTGSHLIVTSPIKWLHTISKLCVTMPSKSRQYQGNNGFSSKGSSLTGLIYDLCHALRVISHALRFKVHFTIVQGQVVQSIVSLTSSLYVISLADSIYNILIFFAEKMWVAFALQKLLTFFQQKITAHLGITRCKF